MSGFGQFQFGISPFGVIGGTVTARVDTPSTFQTPEDICSRAMQHIGARRFTSFSQASILREANECQFCYDKLRRAELRRNCWRFSTRKAALRPLSVNATSVYGSGIYTPNIGPNTGTLVLTPAVWNSGVTYTPGAIVTDPSIPGLIWTSLAQENLNNPPGESTIWDIYYGPMTVNPFDPTTSYWPGELVYVQDPNTQAVNVYRSLVSYNGNASMNTITITYPSAGTLQTTNSFTVSGQGFDNPWVITEWAPQVTYNRDQVVGYQFRLWRSGVEQNVGNVPTISNSQWLDCGPYTAPTVLLASNINWLPIQATVQSLIMAYPLGAGPVQEAISRNAFQLPNGYLREAQQDPTQGAVSYLGAPAGLTYSDWQFEGNYITSRMAQPIMFRFIADIVSVPMMDDMFCEGLAARIAKETCEAITQSTEKITIAEAMYKQAMFEARAVNAIEEGSDQPPEDDYVSCRA